ncbi:uracil-DNA glycosylase family protein [Parvibaculum sp.]|uniref:uracil-DNA glycosylase family protein n=1 Tax=Parvibaculum sp. TaxID=2024848 RepID=UPI00391C7CF3
MTKLERLSAEIRACRLCVEAPKGGALPHEPRPVFRVSGKARICIAGQAPGTRVHASGTPFTDPSGDRLRDWMGVTPDEFYDVSRIAIVPMGFCFPGLDAKGGDLPPRRECAPRWRAPLFDLMPQIELVLAAGQYAQAWHPGPARKKSLTETVAAWQEYYPRCLPLPHPSWRNNAWLNHNPWFEEELLPVLKHDVRRLLA